MGAFSCSYINIKLPFEHCEGCDVTEIVPALKNNMAAPYGQQGDVG